MQCLIKVNETFFNGDFCNKINELKLLHVHSIIIMTFTLSCFCITLAHDVANCVGKLGTS